MTKKELLQGFLEYPYSKIRVKDLKRCIEEYPSEYMPFRILKTFSWRGVYSHPAIKIDFADSTKDANLKHIDDILSLEYTGWKGGEFTYDILDLIHFEENYSSSDSNIGWILFNSNNSFIQFVIKYFEKNKHLEDNIEVLDYTKHIINVGDEVIYNYKYGFTTTVVTKIHPDNHIDLELEDWIPASNVILKKYINFKDRR